ncbi:unnamed protein product [Moneuplotes crassus]|uniref:GP-PDE domain-containing protein n=1 Tax=Euplotes crassus TaxID=5936 RepID=A0AAD1XJS2_EUPCR|nr:unnamed protein product [Moneuplotes crassus]
MWEVICFVFSKLLFFYLVYWIWSLLFFIMPVFHIRNSFKPGIKRVAGIWTIAHRGGPREGLENTIPTFKKALDNGIQVLEMDIRLTKDKRPVVCHDENLQRLCGIDKKVQDFTYSQLPKLQEKVEIHFSSLTYQTTEEDDRQIPLLEDVMKAFPNTPFNMELKVNDQELKVEVLKLIRKYKREQLTIWGSVDEQHCLTCRAMAPEIPTFTPAAVVKKIFFYFFLGFLPFYNIPYDTFQFPFPNQEYINYTKKYVGTSLYHKLYLLILQIYNALGLFIFFHLRRRGIYVFYYSLNEVQDMDTATGKYVDGIITDSPSVLVDYANKKDD